MPTSHADSKSNVATFLMLYCHAIFSRRRSCSRYAHKMLTKARLFFIGHSSLPLLILAKCDYFTLPWARARHSCDDEAIDIFSRDARHEVLTQPLLRGALICRVREQVRAISRNFPRLCIISSVAVIAIPISGLRYDFTLMMIRLAARRRDFKPVAKLSGDDGAPMAR